MHVRTFSAALVHGLTASGVLCTLMAFVALADQDLRTVFLWLGLALFIDAVDGPLARLVDTKTYLPRFSGERLDLIIDYLNFVVLPAFLLIEVPVIEGFMGGLAAAMVLMTSLFHFSDMDSKTRDGYFVGFPAIWNVVVFYLLAFKIVDLHAFAVVFVLSVMTFIPIKYLHPFRVTHKRGLTVLIVLVWSCAAGATILARFDVGMIEKTLLIVTAVYLVALSLRRTIGHSA